MRRQGLRLLLVLAIVALAAACQVDTTVEVAVREDGSGTVTVTSRLDAKAAAQVPDLDQSLLLADAEKAGWKITGPDRTEEGGWEVSAAKPFADAQQLGAVMDQIAGAKGPFRAFTLERKHSFAKTTFTVKGTVDLSKGIDAFGDDALRQALGGTTTGRTPQELAFIAGKPLDQAVRFTVRTKLPGGGTEEWTPKLGDPALPVEASSTSRTPKAWLFGFAAALAALGFLATLFLIARHNRIKRPPSYMHRPGGPRRPWQTDEVR